MIKKQIKEEIKIAVKNAGYDSSVVFALDNPPANIKSDFSTNIALVLSKSENTNPKEIAKNIVNELSTSKIIKSATVAGAGFINIVLRHHTLYDELKNILSKKNEYGKQNIGKGKKVSVDFVSANPTGPLHIGNARGGPIGETVSRLYQLFGFFVSRDFYLNDVGLQIARLNESFYYWYEKNSGKNIPFPADGYPGAYVREVVEKIIEKSGNKIEQLKNKEEIVEYLSREGLSYLIDSIKEDIALLNINFDNWTYESELQKSGETKKVVDNLIKIGATTEKEGAVWFKNPSDPDFKDKESVLVKSDQGGSYTYFADDIAFHLSRLNAEFDLIINIWGSNHHGHIDRMRSALKSLGVTDEKLKIILYQYIRIVEGGKAVKMGKRFDQFVTLRQVIEAGVSPDAFTYFILAQNLSTPFDFDINDASDQSEKNPVYYIQYAYARICSLFKRAGETDVENADLSLLKNEKELALIKALSELPSILEETLDNLQIQALPHYAHKIASLFHDFYSNHTVLGEDKNITNARLCLSEATRTVLKIVLDLCNIKTPEKM